MNNQTDLQILAIEEYPEVIEAQKRVNEMEDSIQKLNGQHSSKLNAFMPDKNKLDDLLVKRELKEIDNKEVQKTASLINECQKGLNELASKLKNEMPSKMKALEILKERLNEAIAKAKLDRNERLLRKIEALKLSAQDQFQTFRNAMTELRDLELTSLTENNHENSFFGQALQVGLPKALEVVELFTKKEFDGNKYLWRTR